jgi:hypothetical protein
MLNKSDSFCESISKRSLLQISQLAIAQITATSNLIQQMNISTAGIKSNSTMTF